MIDLLYLSHNRLDFTLATCKALRENTDWTQVRSLHLYDDRSTDGTREAVEAMRWPVEAVFHAGQWGGPVAAMNDFVASVKPELFAKIDSDTMLPPDWLSECLLVMACNPGLDLLGIEPHHPTRPSPTFCRNVEPARFIGGIGVMRGRAFRSLPTPDGRFGFTAWQDREAEVVKGWLNPALPVCLLDRMPMDPWVSLSREYEKKGWQRPWTKYDLEADRGLWEWFQG